MKFWSKKETEHNIEINISEQSLYEFIINDFLPVFQRHFFDNASGKGWSPIVDYANGIKVQETDDDMDFSEYLFYDGKTPLFYIFSGPTKSIKPWKDNKDKTLFDSIGAVRPSLDNSSFRNLVFKTCVTILKQIKTEYAEKNDKRMESAMKSVSNINGYFMNNLSLDELLDMRSTIDELIKSKS